ncbi:MAG: glycosyltransferase [Thermotogae bacterium]|nr:glycosyltransferase [Thermotogota bacterium]
MRLLPKKIEESLKAKDYKIIVGIPSYNNSKTIGYVTKTVDEGIIKYFNGNGLIVNSDGGSTDGTRDVFLKVETKAEKLSFVYEGLPGKGSAMGSIMKIVDMLEVPVVVFVDSDLRSIEPWWIDRLTRPILEKRAIYVTPYYVRHKYDGTITNNICYPIVSALFGKKIRQPIGGDFGVSLKLVKNCMSQPKDIWETDVAKFGVDIWMTTTAIGEKLGEIYQAALGVKIHDVKDPGKHLGPMFSQVVGTLFRQVEKYEEFWTENIEIENVPIFGDIPEVVPEPLNVDVENLRNSARKGVMENYDFLSEVLGSDLMSIIDNVKETGKIDIEQWVRLIYKFMVEYRKQVLRENMMKALVPLYFAKVADFVERTLDKSDEFAEQLIEEQVEVFKDNKNLLLSFWKEFGK